MQALFWSIFEIASNTIDVLLILYLLNSKLHRGWMDWKKDAVFVVLTTALLTYVNSIGMPFAMSLLLLLAVEETYALHLKPGSLFHRILWPLAAHIVFIGGNLLIILLLIYAPGYHLEDIGGQTVTRVLVVVLYALLTGLAIFMLSRVKANEREAPRWLQTSMIAMGSVSVAFAGYSYDFIVINALENPEDATILLKCALLFFLLSACYLLLFDQVSGWMTRAFEAERERAQVIEQQRSLDNLSAGYASIRAFRHDMNSQLSILSQYAVNEQFDLLTDHLQQMNGEFVPLRNITFCGHLMLDALLTAKKQQAQDNTVIMDLKISIPQTLPLRDIDLCSMVGNLLDNALEAVSALPLQKRTVHVDIHTHNQMLIIIVENSSTGLYLRSPKGILLTTKTDDPDLHGVGLRHVQKLVRKLDGNVVIEAEESTFLVHVRIPLLMEPDGQTAQR